ncbi:MAG: hypothetical protein ACRC36_17845 [Lacrimispora sphenoides]
MSEKVLDIEVEAFNADEAMKELSGLENKFESKMTDGIGQDIGEIIPDPEEPEEEEL